MVKYTKSYIRVEVGISVIYVKHENIQLTLYRIIFDDSELDSIEFMFFTHKRPKNKWEREMLWNEI